MGKYEKLRYNNRKNFIKGCVGILNPYELGFGIFFVLLCIIINGIFVLIETAINESHKSQLDRLLDEGHTAARKALDILDNPSTLLTVVQIGITLTGIVTGVILGVRIAPIISTLLDIQYSFCLSIGLCIAVTTFFSIIIGEFLPKKLALQNPESVLMDHITLLESLERFSAPFVRFLSGTADKLLLLVGINPQIDDTVTEDEVKDLIEQGTEDGTFEKTEQHMVDHIFRMSDQTAYSLMTPRTQMLWLDLEDTLEYNLKLIQKNPDIVFPVGKNNLDDFCGIVYAKDLLNAAIDKKQLKLEDYLQKPLLIPRSMETFRVMAKFQESGVHEAVVLDEYGGVIGFITLNDILEEIIGNTLDQDENKLPGISLLEENKWRISGLCDIDDFKDKFDIEVLPNEEKDHYQTMGGFLTSNFGYIPKVGEKFQWNDFTFRITKLDRARIDQFIMEYTPKQEIEEDEEE